MHWCDGRNWHGCASYTDATGGRVLVVAGGWDTPNWAFLSSSELLRLGRGDGDPDRETWQPGPALPRPLDRVVGVTLDNTVFMIGGHDRQEEYGDIYELGPSIGWVVAGSLLMPRQGHAVSAVRLTEEILQHCT